MWPRLYRVRRDDLDAYVGKQLVVRVVARLVFGEEARVFEFTDVVIVRASLGKVRIFAYSDGAHLREARDRKRMVESAERVADHHFHKRRIVIGKLDEPTVGDEIENEFEYRLEHQRDERLSEHAEADKAYMLNEIESFGQKRRNEDKHARHNAHRERDKHAFYAADYAR